MEEWTVKIVGAYATVLEPKCALTSTLVQIGNDRTLVDCGESTTTALSQNANASPYKIDRVLITHYHFDHYGGLPGFIKKRGLNEELGPLEVYALPSTCDLLENLFEACFA